MRRSLVPVLMHLPETCLLVDDVEYYPDCFQNALSETDWLLTSLSLLSCELALASLDGIWADWMLLLFCSSKAACRGYSSFPRTFITGSALTV